MTGLDDEPYRTSGRLATRLWAARAVIAWERAWPALWPPLGAIGAFVALAIGAIGGFEYYYSMPARADLATRGAQVVHDVAAADDQHPLVA